MHVTKDEAIRKIETAMKRELADREADILNLIRIAEHLVNYLPCSAKQHGDDWTFAWNELADSSQEEIVDVMVNASCEVDELKCKYCFD